MPAASLPCLAAIALSGEGSVEPLFDNVIESLKRRGVRVGGYIQREYAAPTGRDPLVVAEDIETGVTFSIMQPRGGAGAGCRLDSGVLAEVAGRALARLEGDIELLVLNRFGRTETEGSGLRAVYEKAIERGLPVLTSVKPEHVQGWKDYTGDMSVLLPAEEDAVYGWCRQVLAAWEQVPGR